MKTNIQKINVFFEKIILGIFMLFCFSFGLFLINVLLGVLYETCKYGEVGDFKPCFLHGLYVTGPIASVLIIIYGTAYLLDRNNNDN
jgi:hypothetical protein